MFKVIVFVAVRIHYVSGRTVWEFTDSEDLPSCLLSRRFWEISAALHPVDAASREKQAAVEARPVAPQIRLRGRLHGQSVICIRALCSQSVHGRSPRWPVLGGPILGGKSTACGALPVDCSTEHRAPKGRVLHGGSPSRGWPQGMWDRLVEVHHRTRILTLIVSNLECVALTFYVMEF